MIEKILKNILQEKGRVVVPGMGTLESIPISAEISSSGSLISPPNCKVEFSTMDVDLDNLLPKEVSSQTGIPLEDAEKEVRNFGERTLQQAKAKGKAAIAELGTLIYEKGEFHFELYDDVNLLAESYGLPKIHVRPVISDVGEISPEEGKKTTQVSILWLAVIGIIIFGTLLTYLFSNQDIQRTLKATFSTKDTSQYIVSSDSVSENAPIKGDEKIIESKTDKREEKISSSPKEKNEEKKSTSSNEETISTTKTDKKSSATTSNEDIVTTKTNRFYIIVGSYADLKSAQKAMKEAREKGYPSAKVVKSDKIRVSVEDYSSKQEADKAMERIKKDYASCWRLLY